MQKLEITGGKKISGTITISGSKNATLPILASTILTNKKVTIKNIQDYIPDQTHIYANQSLRVSAYTLRWFAKGIKKIIKSKQKRIKDVTTKDLEHA